VVIAMASAGMNPGAEDEDRHDWSIQEVQTDSVKLLDPALLEKHLKDEAGSEENGPDLAALPADVDGRVKRHIVKITSEPAQNNSAELRSRAPWFNSLDIAEPKPAPFSYIPYVDEKSSRSMPNAEADAETAQDPAAEYRDSWGYGDPATILMSDIMKSDLAWGQDLSQMYDPRTMAFYEPADFGSVVTSSDKALETSDCDSPSSNFGKTPVEV